MSSLNQPASLLDMRIIASLPAHYERDILWAQKSSSYRTVLLTPNRLTVNINNVGYLLTAQQEIDISSSSPWDSAATDYTVAANRAGKDFYIYACTPSGGSAPKFVISVNSTVPTGYTASTSRKIGGFHCLCVAVGTISGHTMTGYLAGDILPASIWDLKHRPVSSPEGMVFSEAANIWVDIYLQSGTGTSTASAYGATITDTRSWMDFVDDGGSVKKQLLTDPQFQLIAAGSNEQTSISGSADPNTTGGHSDTAGRRMISNIGCEDCCGAMWQWLIDQSYRFDGATSHTHTENTASSYTQNATTGAPSGDVAPSFSYRAIGGNKGQLYSQGTYGDIKLVAGASWSDSSYSGSRSRGGARYRWLLSGAGGCRLASSPQFV